MAFKNISFPYNGGFTKGRNEDLTTPDLHGMTSPCCAQAIDRYTAPGTYCTTKGIPDL